MITRNFKNLLCCILLKNSTSGVAKGLLPAKLTNGTTYYIYGALGSFPSSQLTTISLATSATTPGVVIGNGTTPATENDHKIESIITGLTGSINVSQGIEDNRPYLNLAVTLTNNGNTDITVSEIGYQQYVGVTTTQGGTNYSSPYAMLLDRTVFSTPITIAPNTSALINYRIYCYWGD